jgi:tetratricopeptide (TPR) repeat protein
MQKSKISIQTLKSKTMKTNYLISALLVLTLVKTASAVSYETLGNQWYAKRAEGAEGTAAKPKPISLAIAYYEKAFESSPTEELTTSLLKSYYFKGSFVPMKLDEQKLIFSKGKSLGDEMMKQYPASVGVKYWYAAILGKWAKTYGAIPAAKEGLADKMKSLGEQVIKMNPSYNDAGGYEVLGLVHLYSPRIPFLLTWPSDDIAFINLKKAAQVAPTAANNLCLAQALVKAGNKILAISLLEKTLLIAPREDKLIEDRNSLQQVESLLNEIK